jgi:hypothetical protein
VLAAKGLAMAESAAFETACSCLEREGSLDRLAARGTIRIALKAAGLEPKTVTPEQLRTVVERLLPGELSSRGIAQPEPLCRAIVDALEGVTVDVDKESPEAVFRRLGGSS